MVAREAEGLGHVSEGHQGEGVMAADGVQIDQHEHQRVGGLREDDAGPPQAEDDGDENPDGGVLEPARSGGRKARWRARRRAPHRRRAGRSGSASNRHGGRAPLRGRGEPDGKRRGGQGRALRRWPTPHLSSPHGGGTLGMAATNDQVTRDGNSVPSPVRGGTGRGVAGDGVLLPAGSGRVWNGLSKERVMKAGKILKPWASAR